jgi:transitional endoplasmic reticulum ATPase
MASLEIDLEIQQLTRDASGFGVVALAESVMERLDLATDDFVGISTGSESVHRAARAAVDDDPDVVGIGEPTVAQLNAEPGQQVEITPLSAPPAHTITVRCQNMPEFMSKRELKHRLSHRIVSPKQELTIAVPDADRDADVGEAGTVWTHLTVTILSTHPTGTVGTRPSTTIECDNPSTTPQSGDHITSEESDESVSDSGYDQIGGLDTVIQQVREVVELPLSQPGLFEDFSADPPTGILLHGPPGTGKTLLARTVANEADAHFVELSASAVFSKWVGETEENIREAFEEARGNAPSIVYIDELDAIASKRDDAKSWEARAVAELLTQLDGLQQDEQVITLAATNRVDAVDPALRRPGRFDREIEVARPDKAARREIVAIQTRDVPLGQGVNLDDIAARTVGYTGADLAALVSEAVMAAIRRIHDLGDGSRHVDHTDTVQVHTQRTRVTPTDIEVGLQSTSPSGLREHNVDVELPETEWSDIGGAEEIKQSLQRQIVWPQQHADLYEAVNLDPGAGVLLHGPPGTGKTMLARAAANATRATVIAVAGPELVGSQLTQAEATSQITRVFQRARDHAPCVIIVDEIDALAPRRDGPANTTLTERTVAQLLTELDGLAGRDDVMVIGTTNRPERLDSAVRRAGRLGTSIHVGHPDTTERQEILSVHLRERPLGDDVELVQLAHRTEGYTGADLAALCRVAARMAVQRTVRRDETQIKITVSDFETALESKEWIEQNDDMKTKPISSGRAYN